MMLLSSEYWTPERILARAAAPFVVPAVGVAFLGNALILPLLQPLLDASSPS